MPTQCNPTGMVFGRAGGRLVVADFDGGLVSSDAGALLLGATDRAIRLVERFARCFQDGRDPAYVRHRIDSLVAQRVFGFPDPGRGQDHAGRIRCRFTPTPANGKTQVDGLAG